MREEHKEMITTAVILAPCEMGAPNYGMAQDPHQRGLPAVHMAKSSGPTGGTGTGDRFPESQGTQEDVRMDETDDESMEAWEVAAADDLNDLKQCLIFEFLEAQPHQPSGTVTDTVDMKDFKDGETITFDSEGYVNNMGATITLKALHFKDKQRKWTRFIKPQHSEAIADSLKHVSMATVDEENNFDKLAAIKQVAVRMAARLRKQQTDMEKLAKCVATKHAGVDAAGLTQATPEAKVQPKEALICRECQLKGHEKTLGDVCALSREGTHMDRCKSHKRSTISRTDRYTGQSTQATHSNTHTGHRGCTLSREHKQPWRRKRNTMQRTWTETWWTQRLW